MKDNEAAEQAYLNAKRQYELDKAEQSAVESAYLTKKAEYDKIMNAYNEKKTQYDADMVKYQADLSKYEADVQAYNQAKLDYENKLKQYHADVEAFKEFDKKQLSIKNNINNMRWNYPNIMQPKLNMINSCLRWKPIKVKMVG